MKRFIIIALVLSLGFISCSMPEAEDSTLMLERTNIKEFEYTLTKTNTDYDDTYITYYYEVIANKKYGITYSCVGPAKTNIDFENGLITISVPYEAEFPQMFEFYEPQIEVLEESEWYAQFIK